jgi:epoxyqueuosine reductase
LQETSRISGLIKLSAFEAGFDLAGIASVQDFPELAHFPEWIAAGRAGEMKYLESRDDSGQLRRASLKSVFPWVRSVIVCAINYNTAHPYSTELNNPGHGWISRYAWSRVPTWTRGRSSNECMPSMPVSGGKARTLV